MKDLPEWLVTIIVFIFGLSFLNTFFPDDDCDKRSPRRKVGAFLIRKDKVKQRPLLVFAHRRRFANGTHAAYRKGINNRHKKSPPE